MPVIETETITRRKIVEGQVALDGNAWLRVSRVRYDANPLLSLCGVSDGSAYLNAEALRKAAAIFTEMAEILEQGE